MRRTTVNSTFSVCFHPVFPLQVERGGVASGLPTVPEPDYPGLGEAVVSRGARARNLSRGTSASGDSSFTAEHSVLTESSFEYEH